MSICAQFGCTQDSEATLASMNTATGELELRRVCAVHAHLAPPRPKSAVDGASAAKDVSSVVVNQR